MIYDYGQMLKRIENEIGKGVYEKNKGNFYYQDELIYYIKNDFKYEVANCKYGHITSGIEKIVV